MSAPVFLTEPAPKHGSATPAAAGIRRIVAANPGPYTYRGTNTYLLDSPDGVTVVDPGPDDAAHVAAILAEARGPIARILLTHSHRDHAGALPALAAASGARVLRFDDGSLADGAVMDGWTALHTPGHAPDHLCLARADGVVLSGDHVMSFSTSVVIPPDGSMAAYFASLRVMLARADTLYLPGHGPPLPDPRAYVEALLAHRLKREAAVLAQINTRPCAPSEIVQALYVGLDPRLHGAAEASVTAHLLKLRDDGLASDAGGVWRG
jgi:glyoxylase-like metal-dependent hydrolase (beta-lactamase superfamily II)